MRAWLLAAASIAVTIALVFARPHPTPGPPMRDFEAYYAAGAVWNAGGNPYAQAIWAAEKTLPGVDPTRYQALPFVGPPAVLPLFGAIARMPFAAANALWRALLVLALGTLALTTLRLAGRPFAANSVIAAAAATLGFGPLTSALALGQVALAAFAFAALACVWSPAGLFAWAQPNVALTLLSQAFTRRGILAFAAALALFAAGCVAVAGTAGLAQYAGVLHQHADAERFSAIQITPASIAYGFGAAPNAAARIGAFVAAAAVCWWFLLMRSLHDATERFCATCALLPLAAPFFHEHDLLVLFVPAIVYATRESRFWTLAAAGALLGATDWLGLAQRTDGTLQTLLLVGSLGAAIVALHERPRARMLLVPGGVLGLIAVAAVFAHAHPAPVWPDVMGSLPRNVRTMDIATAWNAQQRATGLLDQNAVWSGLRLLSLTGSALTAWAVALSSKSPADSRSPLPDPA